MQQFVPDYFSSQLIKLGRLKKKKKTSIVMHSFILTISRIYALYMKVLTLLKWNHLFLHFVELSIQMFLVNSSHTTYIFVLIKFFGTYYVIAFVLINESMYILLLFCYYYLQTRHFYLRASLRSFHCHV